MVRNWAGTAAIGYALYIAVMAWYVFYAADTSIPESLKGTSVDPATFLSSREWVLSEEYSQIRNFIFFISNPFEWLLYFLLLVFGISRAFEKWATSSTTYKGLQIGIYLFLFSLFSFGALFPLNYYSYTLSKQYEISTQTFSAWMKDEVIDFWVNFGLMMVLITVLYWLMKKSTKKWWLYAWLLSIPFSLFLMFVQPVLIDPLYNDFYPLKNKELEKQILQMAETANIPADHVYEVNMAEKTNALNAYVTGIGSNSRIVLWDTTLNTLKENEILFIMAHEMAHYVEKHIYIGIAGYLALSLVGLWLSAKVMKFIIKKWGGVLNISEVSNIRSLPLFLLITSILLFASSPLTNYVSRYQEMRADQYALEMTQNPEAAVSTLQELTKSGLSQVNPPLIVKWFRFSHPTMMERISAAEQYNKY